MTEPLPVPKPILDVFESINAEDRAGFIADFSEDAVVDDWGREFVGLDAIASWNDNENIARATRISVTGYRETEGAHFVFTRVSGHGYHGEGTMRFLLDGPLIARLDITG